MLSTYQNKRVLVLGFGVSGRAAAQFLTRRGAKVIAADRNPDAVALSTPQVSVVPESSFSQLDFDFVVASPGIPEENTLYQKALQQNIPVIGEIELACRDLRQPVLAITGTNGKTTTTLLVEHVLRHAGRKAKAVGNVGAALTTEIDNGQGDEILVLELSSYQLQTLNHQVIDAGVILNITPNHLDRHVTMDAYARAKIHMKECLKPGGHLYAHESVVQHYLEYFDGFPIRQFGWSPASFIYCDKKAVYCEETLEYYLSVSYEGFISHHVDNEMAAFALCREMGITGMQFASALESFKKPPHRIEFVRKRQGVSYFDDSKGTSVDAVIKAVHSLRGGIVLIVGGLDKGGSYKPWLKEFEGRVRAICAIGQAAPLIKRELASRYTVELLPDLEQAVQWAAARAGEGENVLLSPGCSSWDMFKDYAHRGDEFKRIVLSLPEEGAGKAS